MNYNYFFFKSDIFIKHYHSHHESHYIKKKGPVKFDGSFFFTIFVT